MADAADANGSQRRAIYSRRNTQEERLRQKRRRNKRRREREREERNAVTGMQPLINKETVDPAANDTGDQYNEDANDTVNVAGINKLCEEANDPANDSTIAGLKKSCPPSPKPPRCDFESCAKAYSRGAVMLNLARGTRVFPVVGFTEPKSRGTTTAHRDPRLVERKNEARKPKKALKELNPAYLEDLSDEAIGSGSYGKCYLARYRGIKVIVKKMTHNNTAEGKEMARKNLLHEATVVKALGDHERLPLIFGVVTENEPLSLVKLFHGVRDESITLHQAANASMLTPSDSAEIFLQICDALKHVHLRGYLHNDIKANNVVLERNPTALKKYNPILIDFGKSTKAAAISVTESVKRRAPVQTKTYLAPEVMKYRLYSAASDIYSLGRMLKAVSRMVGFYPKVRALVKEATTETPSLRPCIDDFMKTLSAVKFE